MANEAELKTRYQMALTYLGLDDVRNMKKAQTMIMELAAEEDYAPAQEKLAEWYEKGYMFPKDEQQAQHWHKKASGQATPESEGKQEADKSPEELFDLAVDMYWNPEDHPHQDGSPCTEEDCMKIFESLAQDNYAPAQSMLGDIYHYGDWADVEVDYAQALRYYEAAAEQNFSDAQREIGIMYQNGECVPQNGQEAVNWYRKSAEQDNAEAQDDLGVYYYNGDGVEQDRLVGMNWFKKAAKNGSAWGQYHLADCYEDIKDYKNAVEWLHKAADQELGVAQNRLGIYYAVGRGVKQSDSEAVKWYKKAAENGDAWGQYNLAERYFKGLGVATDNDQAAKWYRKAAIEDIADAQNMLGVCYYNGLGVRKNLSDAIKWFKEAAKNGSAWGQYNLGRSYANGDGVKQDQNEAKKWLQAAADQGNKDAIEELKKMGF